jgi:hypothetical protein
MKFPFDDLNMCDAEHVAWVKSQRDPELWHAAATAIVNTVGDPHGFLVWVANQPEMDRATAGYVFLTYGAVISAGRRILTEAKEFRASSGCVPWKRCAAERRPSGSQMTRWVFIPAGKNHDKRASM